MQPVDFTTLAAVCADLNDSWQPARVEQVFQRNPFTVFLCLRTLNSRGWLAISWHPQAARIHVAAPPPKAPDTFTFSQQLLHQIKGFALVNYAWVAPWERVVDLQFAKRPGDPVQWHLYVEIMGKYSNAILTHADQTIVTAAHQVSDQQSSLRPIQTGQPYVPPPKLTDAVPSLEESQQNWQGRVGLIPDRLQRQLVKTYRGISTPLARTLIRRAKLPADITTDQLGDRQWQDLFTQWQAWLKALESKEFTPAFDDANPKKPGYTVLGERAAVESIQVLLDRYYGSRLNEDAFKRLHHQLRQKIAGYLKKLTKKRDGFGDRLDLSEDAEAYRQKADLLMAYLHQWRIGMEKITLNDFETGEPVTIPLDPTINAQGNAQKLYKKHQKLRRSRQAIKPLLNAVNAEIQYLEQVDEALDECNIYRTVEDLSALEEIRDELIEQNYMADPGYQRPKRTDDDISYRRYHTASGYEIWVGRNNTQNDRLTFRLAGDYDLWFHAQEIAGSHVLLRLPPGETADETDLQTAANIAALHSRGRQADAVPVVYTKPKSVYKPKGAKPGMAIYKNETILWGHPNKVTPKVQILASEDKSAGRQEKLTKK
ncbi:MAG: NFACT RNA binding domain-containing protein [Cyanobacteria bacterium P01_C01_bin.89]